MARKNNKRSSMLAPVVDGTAALCDVLQLLGKAAILIDCSGEVVGLNDAAADCLGPELRIRKRRLVADDPAANRALTKLIERTLDECRAHACSEEQVVVARRNTRPLILRTLHLHGRAASLFHPARAMVVVLDASRVNLPTESQLKSAFRLSCGEARLANCLAAGHKLESAARSCGISYETARKRVKAVFEKTETRRQSELVALVIRIGTLATATVDAPGEAPPSGRCRPRLEECPPAFGEKLETIRPTSRSGKWKTFSAA